MANLQRLESINLTGTRISDEALRVLGRENRLKSLIADHTRLSNTGLEVLCVALARIDDDGLAHLSQLKKLQTLSVAGTIVSDRGLGHLTQLTDLRQLMLNATRVTQHGVEKLQAELPDCVIHW